VKTKVDKRKFQKDLWRNRTYTQHNTPHTYKHHRQTNKITNIKIFI